MIEQLRRFIGEDLLAARTIEYYRPDSWADGYKVAILRERQPLIEAFRSYRLRTFGYRRALRQLDDELADLASVAAHYHIIFPTLSAQLAHHHRDKLISLAGQLRPLLLEWKSASHFARLAGAALSWTDPGTTGPEFVVQLGDVEFDVECKRLSTMVTELLGDAEAQEIASTATDLISASGLCGCVQITISQAFVDLAPIARFAVIEELFADLALGAIERQAPVGAAIRGDLRERSGERLEPREWRSMLSAFKPDDARLYARAPAAEGRAVDPICIVMSGPRRTGSELLEYLWQRRFSKAAEQCSGSRGSVLIFEWEGVENPTAFAESEGIRALIARTMDEYRHVAAIVMRCDSAPTRLNGVIDYAAGAYATRSEVTKFPEVGQVPLMTSMTDRPAS